MIPTGDLIAALASNLAPVKRLRPPLLRALRFLLLAGLILAMIATVHGWRSDLLVRLADPRFALSVSGAVLTGILAAIAAFYASQPGRSSWWLMLPLPAAVLWLSSIGYQCLTGWVRLVPGNAPPGETAACFATLVLTSVPLALAFGLMLRYAGRYNATAVIFAASLSIAGLTATGLTLFHPLDASIEILAFNVGTGLLFVTAGGILSRLVSRGAA